MADNATTPTDPDETITYVRSVEYHDDNAEDVKAVRFKGDDKVIEVGITDESMVEFVDVAQEVFDSIHADMANLRDLMHDSDTRDGGGEGDV